MGRILRPASWATVAGLSAATIGLVVLFLQALSEVLADPRLTLTDGYWIGRLPWTAVGVELVVIGATVVVMAGALTAWLAGGLARRVVSSVALAMVAFWWVLLAMQPPRQAVPCAACTPPGPDPMTMAYSQPEMAALFLLLPAGVVGALTLLALVRVLLAVRFARRGDGLVEPPPIT